MRSIRIRAGRSPDTYEEVEIDKSIPHQFYKLWNAPTNGLYGIENEAGNVSVDNLGFLYGSAQIFLFVLAIGAFISVTMKTGAIQTGIGRLALRFRHSPSVLIVVLMAVFALGGTTEGMWEETLGFFALLVPLALALGFDRMTGAAIIFFGAGSGVLASTVNPFATGVASDAAGIGVGDGIGLRVVMWFVIVGAAIAYVLRYAHRVRADPSRSVLGAEGMTGAGLKMADEAAGEVEPLTGRQKLVLVLFFLAFAVMIYGFVPWGDIWDTVFGASFPLPTFDSFYFAQATVLFIVMAVVIGLVARLGEEGTVTTIISGAADFLGAALIIVLARAVTVVMKNAQITDTILHWTENAVTGTSRRGVRRRSLLLVNLPIAFLVPSSSGHAALVMPMLAPLADFAEVPRSIAVTGLPDRVGPGQPDHADVGGDHGRPRAVADRLRPLPALRAAVLRHRPRRSASSSSSSARRFVSPPPPKERVRHHAVQRRFRSREAAQGHRPPAGARAAPAHARRTPRSCSSTT